LIGFDLSTKIPLATHCNNIRRFFAPSNAFGQRLSVKFAVMGVIAIANRDKPAIRRQYDQVRVE